jgi:hypothetical protein
VSDRIPSDHEAVETHRATIESIGRTGRPRVVLPDDCDLSVDESIVLALDGTQYHARVESSLDSDAVVTHAADNRRLARERDGENRLATWVESADVSIGGSAHFDVIRSGHQYGLRTPGRRVVYTAIEQPDSSLSSIARKFEE